MAGLTQRGDIFYIKGIENDKVGGRKNRPAVVVSNNANNRHSDRIEIVYLTTQPKADLPTHVTIRSTGQVSTALCESVNTVHEDRFENYAGKCTEQEMEHIDIALMTSLGIEGNATPTRDISEYEELVQKQKKEIERLQSDMDTIERVNGELIIRNESLEQAQRTREILENTLQEAAEPITWTDEERVRTETERDIYKKMYEELINKLDMHKVVTE